MASLDYYRDVFIYYQAQPSIQLPTPPQADVSISPQSPALQQTNIRQQLDDLSSEDMASPVHHQSAITNIGTCFTKYIHLYAVWSVYITTYTGFAV